MNIILDKRNVMVENQTKPRVWEDSSLCPEISTKNAVQEFHLCMLACIYVRSVAFGKFKYRNGMTMSKIGQKIFRGSL